MSLFKVNRRRKSFHHHHSLLLYGESDAIFFSQFTTTSHNAKSMTTKLAISSHKYGNNGDM
jgi:hypothetical protein